MNAKQTTRPLDRFLSALGKARGHVANGSVTGFIHAYLEQDRTFTAAEYPAHPNGGVWSGVTTPWLESVATIPHDWSWTPADVAAIGLRVAQIAMEAAYIEVNVPRQTYAGKTAAEVLHQRYAQGVFCPDVFPASQTATLAAHWVNDDAEYARQRLGGANPDIVAKYRGSEADLRGFVERSRGAHDKEALAATLVASLAEGALFVCDYRPVLGGVQAKGYVRAGQHFAVPLVFFAIRPVSGQRALMPVAIQLDAPGDGYVFTPADDANSWLLAKVWAASADVQSWFSGTHIFHTHSIDPIFGVAALNRIQQGLLSRRHPMVTLMAPHLRKVFDINSFIYDAKSAGTHHAGIYQAGPDGSPGFTDEALPTGRIGIFQIVNDLYESYRFDDQAFDVTIRARGVDAGNLPVSFPYRDDGQVWWAAIQTFVGEVVSATYADDAAVAADAELCGWMTLVRDAFNRDGRERFVWRATRADLSRIFTHLFFLCTAQHAAVNDTQIDQHGFVPNGAYAMTAPPPAGPGVTDAELLASLPDPKAQSHGMYASPILIQIAVAMSATSHVPDPAAGDGSEASLHATYPYERGSAQHTAVTRFHHALWTGPDSVLAKIEAHQKARIAACGLSPAPNSVAYPYLGVRVAAGQHVSTPVTNCIQI